MTTEIKAHIEKLGNSWEQFKEVNNRSLKESNKNGANDPLTEMHIKRLSEKLDEYKDRLGQLEVAMRRPASDEAENIVVEDEFKSTYKAAFNNYLRKGHVAALSNLQHKSLSTITAPEGGYLVSPQLSSNVIKSIFETSPMRQLASVEVISTDTLEIIEDNGEAAAGWTTETASVPDTDTPLFGKKNITVHELYAQPKATQKLIDDANIDIEAWLAGKVADIFARMENSAFVNGDGVGKPRGILTYTDGNEWGKIERIESGEVANVTADKLLELYYSLKGLYASRSAFLMNRATIDMIRKLKDANGNYLWAPGLALANPDTLLGIPVCQAPDMPAPSAGSLSIALADFRSAYQIVDRAGIRVLRDPFTDKPFVKFYTTKRVGGDVVNFEAIKLMKLGN